VIGLGLRGQLTMKLLEAGGIQPIGIDNDAGQVTRASAAGAGIALERNQPGLEDSVQAHTRGAGADAVIITAGTSSLDPVELAGRLCRQKGRVVVVGSVPTGFSREHYYRKELDLRMSCSYGPGRYDAAYEERGIDYPIGYVRWTENRNMQTFLDLLGRGRLDVEPFITHTFALEEAPQAYQMILERSEPFTGILLEYDTGKPLTKHVEHGRVDVPATDANIGFIGAGSFAQNVLLPAVQGHGNLVGVATARPNNARNVADKYGFQYCTGDAGDVLADDRVNTIFVVTRHDLHAPNVLEALRRGKNVFVEKPLCMDLDQLDAIGEAYAAQNVHLMVGFNRRFAPQVQQLRNAFAPDLPRAILYRINAGTVPPDHWVHDATVGGGRILGEVCHFIDLARYLADAPLTHLAANAMADPHHLQDTLTLTLGFKNGSTASIAYFSNGSKDVGKEYLEVFGQGRVAVLDDFKTLTLYGRGKPSTDKQRRQDKGHGEEVRQFLSAIREGRPTPIPYDEIHEVMRATFMVLESLDTRQMIAL
jgi:polar amino acid transport system substrate-binding protein